MDIQLPMSIVLGFEASMTGQKVCLGLAGKATMLIGP